MKFPNPEQADAHGLLCVGGDLKPETLIEAYSHGIFPWPQKDVPLLWFSPPQRGVLFFEKLKVPKTLKKQMAKKPFEITMNKDFSGVIENCARVPRNEGGCWIIPEMVEAYKRLHQMNLAFSVEAWQQGNLVGGLYGVEIQGVFSGESMFFKESGASKICLVHLANHLKAEGHQWMDIQMVTPVLKTFGGEYVSRKTYLVMLEDRHRDLGIQKSD